MIFHLFTLVFVALKLAHQIDWSWWLVFLPSIIHLTLGILFLSVGGFFLFRVVR